MGMPFYFSSINHSMLSQNPCDSINLFWNQQIESSKAKELMYMTPAYDFSMVWRFPEVATWGNSLLDPTLAIQQTLQNFQNSNSWNNMWSFDNIKWNFTPWTNKDGNDNGSKKNDAERLAEKRMQREYNDLKTLITAYKNIAQGNSTLNPELLDEIEVALNKSGKIEEKLDALKDVYNKLSKPALKKTIASISTDDFGLKERLEQAGYNFGDKDYSYRNAKDTDLNSMLDRIHSEIASISSSNANGMKEFKGLIEPMVSDSDNEILRVISYWNDKYGVTEDEDGNKTNEERSIIRFMIKQMDGLDDNAKKDVMSSANKLVDALTARANQIKDNGQAFDETTITALGNQITNVNKAKEAATKDLTSTALENLAQEFEKLYVMLRRMEALEINQKINNKYGFLNNISTTDVNIINEDIIVKDTEADLKKEGLDGVDTSSVQLVDYQPSTVIDDGNGGNGGNDEENDIASVSELKQLVSAGTLEQAKDALNSANEVKNCYKDKNGTYYTVREGKIIRLDDVIKVYSNGRCKTKDNKMHNISDIKGTEVTTSFFAALESGKYAQEGEEICAVLKKLLGHTPKIAGEEIIDTIENRLTSKNIYYVLKGWQEINELGYDGYGGLCDQIDNEGDWSLLETVFVNDEIKASVIGKIVDCVLDWAKENDLDETVYYKELKKLKDNPPSGIEANENIRRNVEQVDQYIAYLYSAYEKKLNK